MFGYINRMRSLLYKVIIINNFYLKKKLLSSYNHVINVFKIMGLSIYLKRVNRLHLLIKRKSTGSPEEFAQKMNLSRSALLKNLSELRQLGFPIEYDRTRNSYHYNLEKIDEYTNFELSPVILKKILGGRKEYDIEKLLSKLFYEY